MSFLLTEGMLVSKYKFSQAWHCSEPIDARKSRLIPLLIRVEFPNDFALVFISKQLLYAKCRRSILLKLDIEDRITWRAD